MFVRVTSPVAVVLLALFVATSFVRPEPLSGAESAPLLEPWIDTSDRAQVLETYGDVFERPVPSLNWTGALVGCQPGDSSDALRRETLLRISYYRAMAGVPATVAEDTAMSDKAQSAALMMSAEGELTHQPGADYACFSTKGRQAAANSNLYLGRTGPSAIDGYIEDPGDRNVDVGHRSTILHPPTKAMGVGHVSGTQDRYPANALWVFDDHVFSTDYETREPQGFVAWPPRGFVPAEVVYPRWSFALQEADFSQATVSMTSTSGQEIPVKVIARLSKDGEIPSSVIVWEPKLPKASGDDVTYSIGVVDVVVPNARISGEATPAGEATSTSTAPTDFFYEVTLVGQDLGRSTLQEILSPLADAAIGLAGTAMTVR